MAQFADFGTFLKNAGRAVGGGLTAQGRRRLQLWWRGDAAAGGDARLAQVTATGCWSAVAPGRRQPWRVALHTRRRVSEQPLLVLGVADSSAMRPHLACAYSLLALARHRDAVRLSRYSLSSGRHSASAPLCLSLSTAVPPTRQPAAQRRSRSVMRLGLSINVKFSRDYGTQVWISPYFFALPGVHLVTRGVSAVVASLTSAAAAAGGVGAGGAQGSATGGADGIR
jgi:hypothetical protein